MSKYSKTILVGAIALAMAGTAAATTTINAANSQFAWNVTGGTTPNPEANTGAVALVAAAPNILIGRSAATGQITVEATITGAALDVALVATDITPQGIGPAAATVNTVSATPGASSFQFTMTPPPAADGGFAAGTLFSINSLQLRTATGLATLGGNVSVAFTIRDTTTGTILSTASASPVLTSVEATATTQTGADSTIDVFTPSLKTRFVGATNLASLGSVVVAQRDFDATAGVQLASTAGTAAATNNNAGVFQFSTTAPIDTVDLTLTVPNAAAFTGTGRFFADTAACSASPGATAVNFVVNPANSTQFTASVNIPATTGGTINICALANGTAEIAAQTIGISSVVNLRGALTRDAAAVSNASFATLSFNGPVVQVRSFNPASNATTDSLLRVINTSGTGGVVQIDSRCANGATRGPITFTLAGNNAVQYSSSELESGVAGAGKPALSAGLGACAAAGRSSLTITGQIPSMEVQNFLRSVVSGATVTSGNNNDD